MRLEASDGSETITSDNVWIRGTRSYGAGKETPHGLLGVACEFNCLDLTRRALRTGRQSVGSCEVRFPDGSHIVYVGDNRSQLFVRALDALEPVAICKAASSAPPTGRSFSAAFCVTVSS